MSQITGLTVRQHEREDVELNVEFAVTKEHREQVRFSSMSTAVKSHVTRGVAVDLSSGGMGLICRQFVPRMCVGSVRVFDPNPVGTAGDGSPIHEVIFEHRVKVRRVIMETHDPTYAIGVAFVDPEPDIEQRIERLRALVSGGECDRGGADD